MLKRRSFTLLELVIVMIIIGILSTIAVGQYGSYREKALGQEAKANLKLIAAAEKIYKMETGSYVGCDCRCFGTGSGCCDAVGGQIQVPGCNTLLKLNLNPQNWEYLVFVPWGGHPFTAFAQRKPDVQCVYGLHSDDPTGEPYVQSGNCP